MRSISIFVSVLFYAALAVALSWPPHVLERDPDSLLMLRDDQSSAVPASTASPNTASNTGSAPTGTSGSKTTGGSAPSSTPTGKKGSDSGSKSNHTTSSISIDPESPVGGISMLNPAATTTTYYKYDQNITWVWNYTSLIITPQAIDILVSCQDTASTFTVAQNVSVNATQTVIWDTSNETGADVTDKYTLVVYDAGNPAGVTAIGEPGKLAVYDQYIFGMYTPQAYTPLGEGYKCVTCSGAMTAAERQAIGAMMTMAAVTVLSFTYFASGFMHV